MKQQAVVVQQFGSTASAYLTSAVHAQGADLDTLRTMTQRLSHPTVLDLGCGAGHASFAIAPHAQSVTAFDLSAQMLDVVAQAARERGLHNLETRHGNAARLPFADASFDLVVTRFSAHHWLDVPAALREVARVLRPQGSFIVIDNWSPPVSPSVVAAILMIQKVRVTSGTLLRTMRSKVSGIPPCGPVRLSPDLPGAYHWESFRSERMAT